MRPRLLDLFCCEGGASMGYHRAGFDVYGIDIFTYKNEHGRRVGFSRKRYPFPAHQGWVEPLLAVLVRGGRVAFDDGSRLALDDFDAIAASPPCQRYSITNAARKADYPDLIAPTRTLLEMSGLPYVIENVEGAPLNEPILLCGTMFGLSAIDDDGTPLEMWRHRLFESNVPIEAPLVDVMGRFCLIHQEPAECRHGRFAEQVAGSYGGARRDKHEARNVRHGGYVPSKKVQQELLGIDWMTERGMHQSIPPAYTEHIGRQLLSHIHARSQGPIFPQDIASLTEGGAA